MSDVRLSCKCMAERWDGQLGGTGFRVTASAFLCERRHNQGDFVSFEDDQHAKRVLDEWDRAEAEWLEQR